MKKVFLLLLIVTITNISTAQQTTSPYQWDWVTDGIWLGAGFGGTAYGVLLIQQKEEISLAELNNLNKADISTINRWSAGYSSEHASSISDIPFGFSFAVPFTLLLDRNIRENSSQYIGMYFESLSTTAALFTITAGLVDKYRPYVYDTTLDMERRTNKSGTRSFYSGHVAASAAATFFAAKVYLDYHPDTKGKFWIWSAAAAIPATVGYFRLQAGQHFLTDVLIGYALGTATGILVPELHKKKDASFRLSPTLSKTIKGEKYPAMNMTYSF